METTEVVRRTQRTTKTVTRSEQQVVYGTHKTELVNVRVSSSAFEASGGGAGTAGIHTVISQPISREGFERRSITLITPTGHGHRSPNAGGSLSIEPIELGTPITADQMDEKRENRRVYDYLCRLLEVRTWLVECLRTTDIPEEIQLEQNLSNGVLLARLANFFAPDMVPLNKIFDFDQSRYKKDGKPCYRHTDNIVMWAGAARAMRLPEVLIPETVDIYEGRNINTIFCLYALALHLFRLRRGPPIRLQAGNAQFPESVMEEMHERLKDSDIPAFGELSGMLDTTMPSDKDAHSMAIYKINKALNSKDELLKCLKNPDAGILYVNDGLVDNYQALLKDTKNLQQSGHGDLDREQMQKIVTRVNQTDALKRLDVLFASGGAFDLTEMTRILDDLQQESVMQRAIPVYGDLLYQTRRTQQAPLSVQQVDKIVEAVNGCVRIKLEVQEGDTDGLYEVLSTQPELQCADMLRAELKPVYMEYLKHEYTNKDKDFIVLPARIQEIVRNISTVQPLETINACNELKLEAQKGDANGLYRVLVTKPQLQCAQIVREDLKPIYLEYLQHEFVHKDKDFVVLPQRLQEIVRNLNKIQPDQTEVMSTCIRIKFETQQDNANGLYRLLATQPQLQCVQMLREDLKPVYLEYMKQEYAIRDKDFIVPPQQIQQIIRAVNSIQQQRDVGTIEKAVQSGDVETLKSSLQNCRDANLEFIEYYLIILQTITITEETTIEEIIEIIRRVNLAVLKAKQDGQKAANLNRLLLRAERNYAKDALKEDWKDKVIVDYLSDYVMRLEQEIITRQRKFLKDHEKEGITQQDLNNNDLGYIAEPIEQKRGERSSGVGEVYVKMADNSVAFQKPPPKTINEWLLNSRDIEDLIEQENAKRQSETKQLKLEDELLEDRKKREEAARKIQRAWRNQHVSREFKELRNSANPSLPVVRRFIKTLVNTKEDAEEETEIEDNKSRKTRLINTNRHMDEQLKDLDNRIALLVKNRINLQELIEHGKKLSKEATDRINWVHQPNLSDVKHEHDEWDAFEMICYHLQTEPQHIARLIDCCYQKPEELPKFANEALLPLFNFVAEEREEFLFAQLIRTILKRDIDSMKQPEMLRNTKASLVTQILLPMVTNMDELKPKVVELCKQLRLKENQIEFFNLDLHAIYEAFEGEKPTDLKEAAKNEKVAYVLNTSKTFLSTWGIKFAEIFFDKSYKINKMITYLVNSIYIDMKERFPHAPHNDIVQGIAGLIYKCYWEKMITAELKHDNGEPDDDQNKRKAIGRFVEFGVVDIGYGEDRFYLMSLNESIARINDLTMQYLTPMIAEEVEIYQQHKYTDAAGRRKPILHISLPQLNAMHHYTNTNLAEMIPNAQDPLRVLIAQTKAPNADQELYVTLLLHPMPITDQAQTDPQELFEKTKRHLVECLLCGCPGDTVPMMLKNPTLEREEQNYRELPHSAENQASLNEEKLQLQKNLRELERYQLVTILNNYQAIVTAIAKDINREREYRLERSEQLENLRKTITQLEEKRKEYIERLNSYQEYLEKCLENISVTPKRPSIRPDSTKAGKIMKERQSLDAIKKVKISAEKLDKQGILLSVDGYTTFKEYGKLSLEFSTTDRPGILTLTLIESKLPQEPYEFDFQEILRAQSNEETSVKIGGRVNLKVKELIPFLNKQFYSQ